MEIIFQPGDIIQGYSDAFAKILFDTQKGRRCDTCFKENPKLHRCTGCKLMYYCDSKCQKIDWKECHSFECKSEYFKKPEINPLQPTDFKRQMCRLFALLKLHPKLGQKNYKMYDGSTRNLDQLISHHEATSSDPRYIIYLGEMERQLKIEGAVPTGDSILTYLSRLAGIWKTNAFSICNENESETIGSGIFIEPSFFDHSCKPNAIFINHECQIQIRALSSIPKGEKPCVTYLVGHRTVRERAALLMERYKFICKCERCLKEEEEGDMVNYARLNRLISMRSEVMNWKENLENHRQLLSMMRKLYHEYDERITNQCFLIFRETAGVREASNELLTTLGKEAEEHLLVTFGAQNLDYAKLMHIRAKLGITW